jgi:hypothetical protein
VKAIHAAVHTLVKAGFPPTHQFTIMPSSGDDTSRKRYCTRKIGHLGQALKRHQEPHIGITIFEKPIHRDLHAHHLVHLPRSEFTLAERRWPLEVHVEEIWNLNWLLRYVTKERQHLPPDFESKIKRPWRPCREVPGNRWTMTTEAKAIAY